MNRKKLMASVTGAVCLLSALGSMPGMVFTTHAESVVSNDFEVTYEGWHATREECDQIVLEGIGVGGSRGMRTDGRETPADGLSSSKGFYIDGGSGYDYEISVFAETDEVFHLDLLTLDMDTNEETVERLDTVAAKAGTWTKLKASHAAKRNSYEFELTVTTDSTNDFVIDNVEVSHEVLDGQTASAVSGNGLKDVFKGYGFRVGNIFNGSTINNSGIKANFLKDCDAAECENETKADAVLVQNGSTDNNIKVSLNRAASIIDFCVQNNIAFRGHANVWHSQTPAWFLKEGFNGNGNWVSKSVMDTRLESYIKNTFEAYKTQYPTLNLYAYDVCNECINDGTGGAREPGDNNQQGGKSAYVAVYGDNSFIEKAFTFARRYAPENTKLFYNDYNEFAGTKKNGIINTILKPLHEKGVLDGMGMQSHISAAASNAWGDTTSYLAAMDEYLSLGIEVQVTELDISIDNGQSLQDQANKYKAIVQHICEHNSNPNAVGRVTLFQVWGPNDSNTWISGNKQPTLYDGSNQPKLAYTTLKSYGESLPEGPIAGFEVGPVADPEVDENGYWFHHTFEKGTESWSGRGSASVATSSSAASQGSQSLAVTGRETEWNGSIFALSSRIFKAGEAYSFSVDVGYNGSPDTREFKLTLEYTDASGETTWDEIASGTGVTGSFVQLANTAYTIPAGASNCKIIVETTDSTLGDFFIDEAVGAPEGTVIKGAGPAKKFTLGDLDGDGAITAKDLSLAKVGLMKGTYADAMAKRAADVDQSGEIDVTDIQLISQFITKLIDKFPVAERVVNNAEMEKIFNSLKTNDSWKLDGENNALWTHRFGADPGWMVYEDRLYIFTTNDAFEYKNGELQENSYDVWTINCFSSADLVNWTDHGAIPVAGRQGRTNGAAKWANNSWAPDACWKKINGKDKFFLYFADNGSGIGVLTADSPTGPWTDPLGKQLISRSTPNCGNVAWLFDPGVYFDEETGKGYIAFGGGKNNDGSYEKPGTGRIAELGDDMISIVGTPTSMDTPYLFEDSSLIKINGTWYYSYCTNWNVPGGNQYGFNSGEIAYMTASNPLGPYTYRGVALKNPAAYSIDGGGNNHHSLIEFKGKYYVLYHARMIERRMGVQKNYRSCHIDNATVKADGTFSASGSKTGVAQIELLNPYTKVQGTTMSSQSKGISVDGLGTESVVKGAAGEWFKVSGVDFSKGGTSITARGKGVVKVCSGKVNGDLVCYLDFGSNTSEITTKIAAMSSSADLYFVFGSDVEFNSWQINN